MSLNTNYIKQYIYIIIVGIKTSASMMVVFGYM